MNAILAKNVRMLRELKHWTQQHLADTAGILLRTVQRVEKGEGASVETLGALANAFDVTIDILQADFAAIAEQLQREEEEYKKRHDFVEVREVTSSSDIGVLGGVHGNICYCGSKDDAVQDAFARLQGNIRDMADLWDDVDPVSHREWSRGAFEQVKELNDMGFAVVLGKKDGHWQKMPVTILYVVAMPRDEVKPFIAVEKAS
jgi:transcriptional regulator with XRE-family HTH domain